MQVDLNKYTKFVEAITSKESNDFTSFLDSIDYLDANYDYKTGTHGPDINVPLVITCAMGMSGESGEFSEIFKKVIFHKKPYTEETKAHAAKELGDILWYWTNACRALNLDPNQIIADNVEKLSARYPGGKFDATYSENRAEGDV